MIINLPGNDSSTFFFPLSPLFPTSVSISSYSYHDYSSRKCPFLGKITYQPHGIPYYDKKKKLIILPVVRTAVNYFPSKITNGICVHLQVWLKTDIENPIGK